MWARTAADGTWHYCPNQNLGGLLCSSPVAPESLSITRPERPNELESSVCYRCWFNLDWEEAIAKVEGAANRKWLASAPFATLEKKSSDRLSSVLGLELADRLRVLHSLAETYEHETACPENDQANTVEASESPVEIPPRQPKYVSPPKRKPVDPRRRMDYALIFGTIFIVLLIPLLVVMLLTMK